jgi:hypothetical protein
MRKNMRHPQYYILNHHGAYAGKYFAGLNINAPTWTDSIKRAHLFHDHASAEARAIVLHAKWHYQDLRVHPRT